MSLDSFIDSTSKLLAAYPTTAKVSITYSNEHKLAQKKGKSLPEKSASNCVSVKVFEPSLGKCIKYKTYKIKEFSKLLTFLGPRGVSVGEGGNTNKVTGAGSIMSNKKFDDTIEIPATTPPPVKEDKKKKKKKGKK